jgi:hypothetical protein
MERGSQGSSRNPLPAKILIINFKSSPPRMRGFSLPPISAGVFGRLPRSLPA